MTAVPNMLTWCGPDLDEPVRLWCIEFIDRIDGDDPVVRHHGLVFVTAMGAAHAIDRTWAMNINPGGDATVSTVVPADLVPERLRDRLLTGDQMAELRRALDDYEVADFRRQLDAYGGPS